MWTEHMDVEAKEKFDYFLDPVAGEKLKMEKHQRERQLLAEQFGGSPNVAAGS